LVDGVGVGNDLVSAGDGTGAGEVVPHAINTKPKDTNTSFEIFMHCAFPAKNKNTCYRCAISAHAERQVPTCTSAQPLRKQMDETNHLGRDQFN